MVSLKSEYKGRRVKRIALVQGHTDSNSGCSTYPVNIPEINGDKTERVREYDLVGYQCKLVKEIIDNESMDVAVKIFQRDGIGRKGVGKEIKKWKADIVLSFHVNSIGDKPVKKYREILVLKKHLGSWVEYEARALLSAINKFLPAFPNELRGDNGINWIEKGDRGYKNLLYYEKCGSPCYLLEPDFVGHPSKSSKVFLTSEGQERYARGIAEFLLNLSVSS